MNVKHEPTGIIYKGSKAVKQTVGLRRSKNRLIGEIHLKKTCDKNGCN